MTVHHITVDEYQRKTEQMHKANVARIKLLTEDAEAKADEAIETGLSPENLKNQAYWLGVANGLVRSIRVLEGLG